MQTLAPLPAGCTYAVVSTFDRRAVYVGPKNACKRFRQNALAPNLYRVVSL